VGAAASRAQTRESFEAIAGATARRPVFAAGQRHRGRPFHNDVVCVGRDLLFHHERAFEDTAATHAD
jgi:succinylarginine dihydrolase